jgi:putative DNA primase/helicase
MVEQEFSDAMASKGVVCIEAIIGDGVVHRFASNGRGDKAAWYIFFGKAGAFGDWERDIKGKWSLENGHLSPQEREDLQKQIEKAKEASEKVTLEKQNGSALSALAKWNSFSQIGTSPYLERKKVHAFGVRFARDTIVVPLKDITGKLWSLQWIASDGTKRFLAGGRKKGCFHLIGTIEDGKPIYVTEGYATGASVYMAIQQATIIAFDAGNLEPVISELKTAYPKCPIVIAGDDDCWKETNTGRRNAEQAANKYGCTIAFPTFKDVDAKPTDFNDVHVLEGAGEVKKQLEQANCVKEIDPLPINSSLLPVLPFTLDMLPEPLQPWVKDIAYRQQCPMDFVAIPTILMIASLIGSRCSIKPYEKNSWSVVPNLWGGILGDPGTMKSPVCTEVLFPFKYLEAKAKEDYKAKKVKLEAEKIVFLEAKCSLEHKIKEAIEHDTTDKEVTLDALTQKLAILIKNEPVEAAYRRYKVSDTTVEKMQEILSKNPHGVLVYRDELMGFLESWEKKGHESDRSFYLEAWNGDQPYTSDRISRGTVLADNICVSILGTTQPDKILPYLHKAIRRAANDGLLQRFQLLVYPDKLPWKVVDEYPDTFAKDRVFSICKKIDTMQFTEYGAQESKAFYEGQYTIPFFRFSPEAQPIVHNWLNALDKKFNNGEHEIIEQHLAKYRSLMPSLVLIFHIINLADGKANRDITVDCVERAVAWCEYLESHARRIYGMVLDTTFEAKPSPSKAEELLAWMHKQSVALNQPLKRRFIMRYSKFRSSKELDLLLNDLIQMEHIKQISQNTFCTLADNLSL